VTKGSQPFKVQWGNTYFRLGEQLCAKAFKAGKNFPWYVPGTEDKSGRGVACGENSFGKSQREIGFQKMSYLSG
jgi:hypothetical protein